MSAQPEVARLTWAEYLRFLQAFAGDERFELDGGRVVLMPGGSERHDLMATSIYGRLLATVTGGPCRVFIHNRLLRTGPNQGFYPDLLVRCGPAADPLFETDARIVVELLSPSNGPADRTARLFSYQGLPSAELIVFVDQERRVFTLHERTPHGWSERQFGEGVGHAGGTDVDLTGLWSEMDGLAST